jgi:hypothetical protein
MRYESPAPIGRAEALEAINSGEPRRACEAIIRLALNDPDGRWVEGVALRLAESADPSVRATAATALGHVARIHRKIDSGRVLPALRRLMDDPRTAGRAEDALSDIAMFASGSLLRVPGRVPIVTCRFRAVFRPHAGWRRRAIRHCLRRVR